MAHGRKTGGRKLGSRNKATLERELAAARACDDTAGKRLAKEVLSDFMHRFAAHAERCFDVGDFDAFSTWGMRAVECAKVLAPFESPRYSTSTVGTSAVNKIEIVGGLPPLWIPGVDGELAPGTIICAEEEET